MTRFALLVEYDGTPFCGWQRQRGLPSVQGAVEAALARLDPAAPLVSAAGRTDTGVHATGQVAHCELSRDWDPFRLRDALNHHLRPAPVAIATCAPVDDRFHARFSATGRQYRYRVLCRRAPPALTAGQVWHVRHPLELAPMRSAAQLLLGHHDFTTFRATQCQAPSPFKTLDRLEITEHPVPNGVELHFSLAARSFLHNQVRSMVGTLVRVGAGAWSPEDVARALAARDRTACGPVAPSQGLCLTGVVYPVDPFATPCPPGPNDHFGS